jgi:hypothetical protein
MPPSTCYRLIVAGPLSQTAAQLIDTRFGSSAVISPSDRDSEVLLTSDQPALRALLTLLWDLGHDLLAFCACPGRSPTLSPSEAPANPTRPKETTS